MDLEAIKAQLAASKRVGFYSIRILTAKKDISSADMNEVQRLHNNASSTIAALVAEVERLNNLAAHWIPGWERGEWDDWTPTAPATTRRCPECGKEMSNLTGAYLLRGLGETKTVCKECQQRLLHDGWVLIGQEK